MMLHHNLDVFIKVAEYRSATLAAKELYISQPAVSNVIRRLEDELQVKLFYRDRKQGLILTDIGEKIFAIAKRMEDLDNRLYQTAFAARHLIGGKLRIAAVPFLTSALISPALQRFHHQYPRVEIELLEGMPSVISQAIEMRRADFAVSCTPYENFEYETLIHDRFVAIAAPGVTLPDYVDLRHCTDTLVINRPAYETLLAHSSYIPDKRQVILVQQPESAIAMVNAGVGIGIISEYTLDTLAPDLVKCPLKPAIVMDIGIFADSLETVPPAAAAFIRTIKDILP